jgi:uncharacterized phage protein gp47/JayE
MSNFERPTLDEIYARIKADMESRVNQGGQITKVSILGILSWVFAGAIYLVYGFLAWWSDQLFIGTATDIGRERYGRILNLPRKAATFSTGQVAFTGTAAKVVPSGTVFTNVDGYEYSTTEDFTIGTSSSVTASSLLAGALYNTAEATFELANPDADIDSTVTRVSGFDDGVDLESDDAWDLRLLQRMSNPPASGAPHDYIRWALKVPGVGRAWALDATAFQGAGTVAVVVATEDLQPVSAGILTDVETYIDTVKPIPAQVTYYNIVPVPVAHTSNVDPKTADTDAALQTNLEELHDQVAEPGGTLLYSQVLSAYTALGYTDFTVTAPVANVTSTFPEVITFGSSLTTQI